jgi:transcription elongation factor
MKPDEVKIGMRVRVLGGVYMAGCAGVVEEVRESGAKVNLDYNNGTYFFRAKWLEQE